MQLNNYTIDAPVLDIVRTRKNLTATALDGLALGNMKRGHEYWRLDTLMLDGKMAEFMERLNDPDVNADEKQPLLEKHCTNVDDVVDWLADANVPERLDWRRRGDDAWSLRVDDMEIQLLRMSGDEYVVTQTMLMDDSAYYKQYVARICTDAPLADVKKKALDLTAERMRSMSKALNAEADIVQHVAKKEKPSPGMVFSTEHVPEEHYEKWIQCRSARDGIQADGWAEAQSHAAARLSELKGLLEKDLNTFSLLVIERSVVRQYGTTRQATCAKSLENQRLADIVDLAIGSNGYAYGLYADKESNTIRSEYTDYRAANGSTEYRLIRPGEPFVAETLDAMLSDLFCREKDIRAYVEKYTESLYPKFERCLKGTDLWPN